MRRLLWVALYALLVQVVFSGPAKAQDTGGIGAYFTGKEVALKIDMPGTQRGVDVNLSKFPPLNWKDYGDRLKQYGVAIPKGSTSRVTAVVVKKDRIEFQLDGGGFGTVRDDQSTTVNSIQVNKSDYEKRLENQIANTDDPDRKRQLQRDLDRERDRRERQQRANDRAAQVASQIKAAQVADKRQSGGSRFNLRWSGRIPEAQLTPDAVMHALTEYVDFGPMTGAGAGAGPTQGAMNPANAHSDAASGGDMPATAQMRNGMSEADVTALFGDGREVSHATTNGLETKEVEYMTSDRRVVVTSVNGIVVRYSISSR